MNPTPTPSQFFKKGSESDKEFESALRAQHEQQQMQMQMSRSDGNSFSSSCQIFQRQYIENQRLIKEQQDLLMESQTRLVTMQHQSVARGNLLQTGNVNYFAPSFRSNTAIGSTSSHVASLQGTNFPPSLGVRAMRSGLLHGLSSEHSNTEAQQTNDFFSPSLLVSHNACNAKTRSVKKQTYLPLNGKVQQEDEHSCLAEFAPILNSIFGGDDHESVDDSQSDASCALSEFVQSSAKNPPASASFHYETEYDLNKKSIMWQRTRGDNGNASFVSSVSSMCAFEPRPLSTFRTRRSSSAGDHLQGKINSPIGSVIEKKKKVAAKRRKKPKDMPRRPLSGYNLFFKDERARILAERERALQAQEIAAAKGSADLPGSDLKVGFERLAQLISQRWNALSENDKIPFKARAEVEMKRYRQEMIGYKEKLKVGIENKTTEQPAEKTIEAAQIFAGA
jgi:hypothetical protein